MEKWISLPNLSYAQIYQASTCISCVKFDICKFFKDLSVNNVPMQWLVEYNAALASICFMTLLGFVDDVLDVPWRV